MYLIRKPWLAGGEVPGLSGCAFQLPAEEAARDRKDNHVCEEGRGLAGLQMSLQFLLEGWNLSGSICPGCPGTSASETLFPSSTQSAAAMVIV